MTQQFVGTHPESLASGRPLTFGDLVEDSALDAADERLRPLLVPATTTKAPAPAAAPSTDPEEQS